MRIIFNDLWDGEEFFDSTNFSVIGNISKYWEEKGLLDNMVMEEAAELIQAINKGVRIDKAEIKDSKKCGEICKNIEEEIGDLLIILLAYIHSHALTGDIDEQNIFNHIIEKIEMEKEM